MLDGDVGCCKSGRNNKPIQEWQWNRSKGIFVKPLLPQSQLALIASHSVEDSSSVTLGVLPPENKSGDWLTSLTSSPSMFAWS